MSKVIISTLLMMGGAFIIGFAVACLVKFISFTLNYFEKRSLIEDLAARKRLYRIHKIRYEQFKRSWPKIQRASNNDLLDYYYPYKTENTETNTTTTTQENELIRYYYGEH